jgi:hypothetical protein
MSTDDTGDAKLIGDAIAQAKALLDEARSAPAEQLDMLDPVTPEEMLEARDFLGPDAGRMAVLRHAREAKRGRPPGARNKRTDDFSRYIKSFGQHPAITMMQIQATDPHVLVENSHRRVTKLKKGGKDRPDELVTFDEYTLTYEAAQSLRIRCAEGLLPYIESKKPVAVDMSFSGVADLVIQGVTHSEAEMQQLLEGDFMELPEDESENDR